MLDSLKLAIIDLETTGASALYNRIIEIGIKRIEHGRVVETYSTLVNPGQTIPPFITSLTGITSDDVEDAPRFDEVAGTVTRLLEDCVFVAHNARFDYGFIRHEFERLEQPFEAQCLCTVRLSRLLYPEHRRHNLSSLIERFQLPCENRHRALGDAEAVWAFLQHIRQAVKPETLEGAINNLLQTPTLPPNLSPQDTATLPNGPGVYVFYDADNHPLYIGKSVALRERVLSHFSSDHRSTKETRLCQQVARIETRQTCGELGALLLESHLIKETMPLHNRLSRLRRKLTVLVKAKPKKGYDTVRLDEIGAIAADDYSQILGLFKNRAQAKEFLSEAAREHKLCLKLLGLERSSKEGPCFYTQLKLCRGACTGKEPAALYNARLATAFTQRRIKSWPFPGAVLIEEANPERTAGQLFVIDQWRLVKALNYSEEGLSVFLEPPECFDYDSYKIIARHLLRKRGSIKALSDADYARLAGQAEEAAYS